MRINWRDFNECLIVALIVVSVFELELFYWVRGKTGLYHATTTFPSLAGFASNRQRYIPAVTPCVLVRVSSDSCNYCRVDQPFYRRFVEQVRHAGCESFIVSPKSGQLNFQGDAWGTIHLRFVDYRLGRILVPFVTPQTILLDGDGHIRWYREGTMDQKALAKALRELARLHSDRGAKTG
jgi:hypothetical protein